MLVYRIEHREMNIGPFRISAFTGNPIISDISQAFIKSFCDVEKKSVHPLPEKDGFNVRLMGWDMHAQNFGCPDFDTIFVWFGDFMPMLKKADFVLRVLEVDEVVIGRKGTQVMFDRKRAEVVETIEL